MNTCQFLKGTRGLAFRAILTLTAVLFLAVSILFSEPAQAKQACGGVNPYTKIIQCTYYIELNQLTATPPEPQKMSLWCWAASLSMIYTMEGHPISQEEIVRQNFGQLVNAPGGDFLTFEARLNSKYIDANGKPFRSVAKRVETIPQAMTSLRENIPILYTTKAHATVQTALTVNLAPNGGIGLVGGQIWDPQPSLGLRNLSPQDFATYAGAWYIQTIVVE